MWISTRLRPQAPSGGAELGAVTIPGASAGAAAAGEERDLPVYAPGGYVWMPRRGDTVLVIKGGPGGEERCAAGARPPAPPAGMQPGEVYLFTPGGASVWLRNDGSIALTGSVSVSGSLTVNGRACNAGQTLTV